MASVAKSIASESQACRFNSCQDRDLKLHFFLVTKVFRNKDLSKRGGLYTRGGGLIYKGGGLYTRGAYTWTIVCVYKQVGHKQVSHL